MKTQLIFTTLIFFISCGDSKQDNKNAEQLFKESNYEGALLKINKVIELEPDSISHYSFRVRIYDLMARYKEEISDLNKIIEINNAKNNKSPTAHHQRAVAQTQLGLYKEALSDIDYFIENRDTVGSLVEAYINKGSILYKLKDFANAKIYYELAIKENKGMNKAIQSSALVGLAKLSKLPNEALKLLDKAIYINNNSSIAYDARATIYTELGKINDAYSDFKLAMTANPNDAKVSFNLGQLFANYLGKPDSASYYFQKAINLAPQSPENDKVYMNLAVLEQRSGKLESALNNFKQAEIINPKNDLLLYNLAMLLSDLEKPQEALVKINKAISLNSTDPEYFNLKGVILMELLLLDDASKAFLKAINLNPNYGLAYYNLGYLFSEQEDHNQSIKYYNKAIILNYDLKATLVNRALEKLAIEKTRSACEDLEKAYKLGRKDIKPLLDKNCR